MDLTTLKEAVMWDLMTPQGHREIDEANKWPDVDLSKDGADLAAIEGIVEDVIHAYGYYRLDPLFRPEQGCLTYGQVVDDGSIDFIRVTWDVENETFNPFQHIERLSLPPADVRYVQGTSCGL